MPDDNQDRDKFKPSQKSEITQTAVLVLTAEFVLENPKTIPMFVPHSDTFHRVLRE